MERLTCPFVFTLIGAFLLVTGTGLALFGVRRLTASRVYELVAITNHSNTFNRWIQPNKTTSFRVYIFNVTNPDDVIAGSKPRLMSIGPYTYEISTVKKDLYRSENFLSYRLKHSFRFDPGASGQSSEYDEITLINVPLVSAGGDSKLSTFHERIFMRATVKEFLFDGISIECSLNESEGAVPCENLKRWPFSFVRKVGKELKFSFFHHRTGTPPETYTIHSGNKNIKKTGEIKQIDDLATQAYCDLIKGSDGTQFPMPLNITSKLFFFDKNYCRSIYIEFEKVIESKGLQLYRYVIKKDVMTSKNEDSMKECLCRHTSKLHAENLCYKTGYYPLYSCTGRGLIASYPHFYLTDDDYYNFDILKPSKRFHQTYFDIEPNFGITIASCKRFQLNLDVGRITAFNSGTTETTWFTLSDQIFPILWTEEKTGITEEYYENIKYRAIEKDILETGTAGAIVLGATFVGLSYLGWFALQKLWLLICKCLNPPPRKVDTFDLDDTWESQTRRIQQMKRMKIGSEQEGRITCQLGTYFHNLERSMEINRNSLGMKTFM